MIDFQPHIFRLESTLEVDWNDLFKVESERPSLETLDSFRRTPNPIPYNSIFPALGPLIEERRLVHDELFKVINGEHDVNTVAPGLHQLLTTAHPTYGIPDLDEVKERASLLIAISSCHISRQYSEDKDIDRAITWFGFARHWQGIHYQLGAKILLESIEASKNARIRWVGDPVSIAKGEVKKCWELWQSELSRYKSKAAFARDMLDKYEELTSQRVIERWCKEWETEPS